MFSVRNVESNFPSPKLIMQRTKSFVCSADSRQELCHEVNRNSDWFSGLYVSSIYTPVCLSHTYQPWFASYLQMSSRRFFYGAHPMVGLLASSFWMTTEERFDCLCRSVANNLCKLLGEKFQNV